jgi:hypothetical protein
LRRFSELPVPGGVVVVARVVAEEVVARVVDPPEGQRRAQLVAFGGVVVDHVHQHLDPRLVKAADHQLELVEVSVLREVALGRREEAERVVAPVVREPFVDEVPVVVEGLDRQELDRGDAELHEVVDHVVLRQPLEGAAEAAGRGRRRSSVRPLTWAS